MPKLNIRVVSQPDAVTMLMPVTNEYLVDSIRRNDARKLLIQAVREDRIKEFKLPNQAGTKRDLYYPWGDLEREVLRLQSRQIMDRKRAHNRFLKAWSKYTLVDPKGAATDTSDDD